ncbi:MAG: tRNA (adenosine(37)-N6)-threonylcarbamoyltransferase complex dimerization subunit type 1 TsaB [bacterium]|nr:MAG: tRNA (adenosine(37)-N6)-threonylcarbamoyltransferase complex dimerization subunit type 1 TsaB [bacterium]
MKILGIDTSTDICGVALTEDKKLITEFRSNIKQAHAEKIIHAIDRVLNDVNLKPHEIDGIAISIGPGSFTGLRIGLAAVKGLALATNLPVVSVASLDALVLQAYFWRHQICPLVKARADEAYLALYHFRNGQMIRNIAYQLVTLNSLHKVIKQKTLIINVGMKDLVDFISGDLANLVEIAPPEYSMTSGYYVAMLGFEKFNQGEIEDINTLEPFYLKDFKTKKKYGL